MQVPGPPFGSMQVTCWLLISTFLSFGLCTTRFVSDSGFDIGNCTIDPCLTLGHVQGFFSASEAEILTIDNGLFDGFESTVAVQNLDLTLVGSAATQLKCHSSKDYIVRIGPNVTLTLQGLALQGGGGDCATGVRVGGLSSHVNVQSCTFLDGFSEGALKPSVLGWKPSYLVSNSFFQNLTYGVVNDGPVHVFNSVFEDSQGASSIRMYGTPDKMTVFNISDCTFRRNSAGAAGVIRVAGSVGNAGVVLLTRSIFHDNVCPVDSFGCVFTSSSSSRLVSFNVTDCCFWRNSGYNAGAALRVAQVETMVVSNCLFEDNFVNGFNTTTAGGGAVEVRDGNILFKECVFRNNYCISDPGTPSCDGGALNIEPESIGADITIRIYDSLFFNNSAEDHGGALNIHDANTSTVHVIMERVIFEQNRCLSRGGAARLTRNPGTITLVDTVWIHNEAASGGDALSVSDSDDNPDAVFNLIIQNEFYLSNNSASDNAIEFRPVAGVPYIVLFTDTNGTFNCNGILDLECNSNVSFFNYAGFTGNADCGLSCIENSGPTTCTRSRNIACTSPFASPSTSVATGLSCYGAASPTISPTAAPSGSPTLSPSSSPTASSSSGPSMSPSSLPSALPSVAPSSLPTSTPTSSPTGSLSADPTISPSSFPSPVPSVFPSSVPTSSPSATPSLRPTKNPTKSPTSTPTLATSDAPSVFPSASPTLPMPTTSPSQSRTISPTIAPPAIFLPPVITTPTIIQGTVVLTTNTSIASNLTVDSLVIFDTAILSITESSFIQVTGAVVLDGILEVMITNKPQAGVPSSVDLISGATISGAFDVINVTAGDLLACEQLSTMPIVQQGTFSVSIVLNDDGCQQQQQQQLSVGAIVGIVAAIVGGIGVALLVGVLTWRARQRYTKHMLRQMKQQREEEAEEMRENIQKESQKGIYKKDN